MDVGLFITCLTDTFYPRVGAAVVRVLRHLGCRVRFPAGQTCCGQPGYNTGDAQHAATLVQRMAGLFDGCERVVTPSASCARMVCAHGPELLAGTAGAAAARRLADRTREFCTFVERELGLDIAARLRFAEPVTYHYPCHAREAYSVADLERWLSGPGHELRRPTRPDLCCGFGGAFAVEFPEVSTAMLGDKLAELSATGARLVICNEAACALQMSGGAQRRGLPLRFRHLAECLAESLGLMEPGDGD